MPAPIRSRPIPRLAARGAARVSLQTRPLNHYPSPYIRTVTEPQVDDWHGPSTAFSEEFLADTGGFNGTHTRDTDGDGMPDWWEVQYGLNPNFNDAAGDADGDGISNLVEYNSGSNPIMPDS